MRTQLHKVTEDELDSLLKDSDSETRSIALRLYNEMTFLEEKMAEEKSLPFLDDEGRVTGAAQLYRAHVAEYVRILKALSCMVDKNKSGESEESPLQAFMKKEMKEGN